MYSHYAILIERQLYILNKKTITENAKLFTIHMF